MAVRQIEPIDRAELRATIQKWIDAHTDVDDTDGCEAPLEYYDPDDYGHWLAYNRLPEGEEDNND